MLSGSYAIPSELNFQRFCSNFLATEEQGFDRPLLLTNEEGIDWVNRSGQAWPAVIGAPEARQIGTVVAIDEKNGKVKPIWEWAGTTTRTASDPGLRQAGRALG